MNRERSAVVVRRRRHRRVFAGAFGFLLFQAAAASFFVEPYPAFIYPHFARAKGEIGSIDVLVPEFIVEFADGGSRTVGLSQVFKNVPSNLAIVMGKEMLLDPEKRGKAVLGRLEPGLKQWLVTLRTRLREKKSIDPARVDPELRGWFRGNLQSSFPTRAPSRLIVKWWSQLYTKTSAPELFGRHLIDSFSCDLTDAS